MSETERFIEARAYKMVDESQQRVYYYDAKGPRELREGGTRSWQTRNPGNVEYGVRALKFGAIGKDNFGMAIFADENQGVLAKIDVVTKQAWKDKTIAEMIAAYAPKDDGINPQLENNDPVVYANNVAKISGLDVHLKKMHELTPEELKKLINAMGRQEGYREGRTTLNDVEKNQTSNQQDVQVVPWESLTPEQRKDLKPLAAWNEKGFTTTFGAKGTLVSSHDSRGNEKTIQLFGPEEMRGQVAGMNAQQAAAQIHQEMYSAQQEKGAGMER